MGLFTRDRTRAVQSLLLRVINNNCPELAALIEGPRLEQRVNLTIVALVVPIEGGRPQVAKAFTAVTKEFSTTGLALVLDGPVAPDEMLVGLRWDKQVSFLRATAKHLSPMGGDFYQLGVQLTELIPSDEYPDLKSLSL